MNSSFLAWFSFEWYNGYIDKNQLENLLESIITVVAVGLLVGMMVLMVRYARFIHKFPTEGQKKENPETSKDSKEDFHNKES